MAKHWRHSPVDLCPSILLTVLLCALVPVLASLPSEFSQEGIEYCEGESFNATCSWDEVVVMRLARYGRMRTGRCLTAIYTGQTCSSDVTSELERKCSGLNRCVFDVSSILNSECGSKEFKSFLEASYECIKAANAPDFNCSNESKVQLPVAETGFLASVFASRENTFGCESHPINIRVHPHQRINLTLTDFSVSRGDQTLRNLANPSPSSSSSSSCVQYALATELHGNGSSTSVEICGGRSRESAIYTSTTNTIVVQFNKTQAHRNNFIIKYQAIGCAPVSVPPNAWISRSTDERVSIHCNKTEEAWHLVCHGVQWEGQIGNCSSVAFQPTGSNDDWAFSDMFASSTNYPFGVLIVVCLGVTIGVAIGVLLLVIVVVYMRRRRNRRIRSRFSTFTLDNKTSPSNQSFTSFVRQQITPLSAIGTMSKDCWTRSRPLPDPQAPVDPYFRYRGPTTRSTSTFTTPFELTLLSPSRQKFDALSLSEGVVFSNTLGARGHGNEPVNQPHLNQGTAVEGDLANWQPESCSSAEAVRNDTSPYYFKLDPRITERDDQLSYPHGERDDQWLSYPQGGCAFCLANATMSRSKTPIFIH